MSRARLCIAAAILPLGVCILGTVTGCGGEGGVPPAPGDVPLTISVVADTPGAIDSLTLATGRADTLDVDDASARIERADGTSARVQFSTNVTRNVVTFGQAVVTPSGAGIATSDGASNGPTQADVPFLAEIAIGVPDGVASATVTVTALEPGDTFDISAAHGSLQRGDGTSEPVAMSVDPEGTVVTIGPATLSSTGSAWSAFHALAIDGPVGVRDGATATTTEIGSLAFFFWVDPDGTVTAPSTIRASIPTIGCARDGRVVIAGLSPQQGMAWTAITDRDGGRIYSRTYVADASGQLVIPDSKSQITAERLSGPQSRIELHFADWKSVIGPPVAPPGVDPHRRGQLNVLVVDGPIRISNGHTGQATEIGRLRLGFEVLGDGTVIAPGQIKLNIPTNGTVGDPRAIVTGLDAGEFFRASLTDTSGATSRSRMQVADASGQAVIAQALGGMAAGRLSGPRSQIALSFARTDVDDDGYPDVF